MDPLTAIGLASNVLSFIDFAVKLITKTHEIGKSADGNTVENAEVEVVTRTLAHLYHRIDVSSRTRIAGNPQKDYSLSPDATIGDIAAASGEIANDLLQALARLRASGSTNMFTSLYYGLKTILSESRLESLRARLSQYQTGLQVALLVSVKERCDAITPVMLENLRSGPAIDQIKADILEAVRENRNKNESEQIMLGQQLTALTKPQTEDYMQRQIIQNLSFDNQDDRVFRISEAHFKTFRWIFEEEAGDSGRKWSSFPSWLVKDDPLYWITGKPGSGKSTLMKFLMSQEQSEIYLRRWTKNLPLLMIKFFFWSPGSPHQQSQEGLLRSVLYQALCSIPELTSAIFPKRWVRTEVFGYDNRPWSMQELMTGFNHLLTSADGSFKLCMFIDGLDEFDGDLDELVQLLRNAASRKNVKACLSSRPWVVFEEAFQAVPSLMLHNLTYDDIMQYVTARFESNSGFQALKDHDPDFAPGLITNVVTKASGVFLWVHLVTKSLINGMSNFDRMSDLQKRLDEFPDDLEDFYQKIFDSIEDRYRVRACQYFLLVRFARGHLTTVGLSYADEERSVLNKLAGSVPAPLLTPQDQLFRVQAVKRRINSHCKGILEITSTPAESLIISPDMRANRSSSQHRGFEVSHDQVEAMSDPKITYLHRTAKDFIESPNVWLQIQKYSQAFNPYTPLMLSELLLLKQSSSGKKRSTIESCVCKVLTYAEDAERNHVLDPASLEPLDAHLNALHSQEEQKSDFVCCEPNGTGHPTRFVEDAARRSLHSYIMWKISHGCTIFAGQRKDSVVLIILSEFHIYASFQERNSPTAYPILPSLETIKCVLNRAGLPGDLCQLASVWIRVLDYAKADLKYFQNDDGDELINQLATKVDGDQNRLFVAKHWANVTELFLSTAIRSHRPPIYCPTDLQIQEAFGCRIPKRVKELLELRSQLKALLKPPGTRWKFFKTRLKPQ